ncbi:MAG: hypothetical protein ABIG36_01900 [Pseudomonadota bacterium]
MTWLLALLTLRLAAAGAKPAIRVEISVDGHEFLFSDKSPHLKIEQIASTVFRPKRSITDCQRKTTRG